MAAPRINIIFARARNGVIGKDGQMPWHLPEDLAHFKAQTGGAPVLMGRKTWDSLPSRFRPLPGRRNVVITRQDDWQAAGAERAASLQDAIALCSGTAGDIWVIGGGEIYAQAVPLAQRAVVTEIDRDFEGDTFAPELKGGWRETARSAHTAAKGGLSFSFVTYERTAG